MISAVNSSFADNFLLPTPTARRLYVSVAGAPIIDYHCHLDPRELAADRRFENVTQLWIASDPYKHRLMRLAGVPERLITGTASDREKFAAWAATVPRALGNPLHHWTALELLRTFGIEEPLDENSAERIWHAANARLGEPEFSARGLLRSRGVIAVCTSDRLLDDLAPHGAATRAGGLLVLPSLRADDVIACEAPEYLGWLQQLEQASGRRIGDLDSFQSAVAARLDAFQQAGCLLADHGLDVLDYRGTGESETAALFARRLEGTLDASDAARLRSGLLRFLGAEYARRGWILQLHLGAQRRTSSRLRRLAGPAGGYAGVGQPCDLPSLCAWFDDLERADALPRTILYPLHPVDLMPLAVLAGSFAEDGVAGKLQLGPAWWYNDHRHGMRAQLQAVANHGLLGAFIGMTTDSRSLLSMVRHEYFRRVLCEWLGEEVEAGRIPADQTLVDGLVRDLCSENARRALRL